MDDTTKRFALGIFFDGLGSLLLGVAMFLNLYVRTPTTLDRLGILVILLAVAVHWAAALYFAVPAALRQWRER